MTEGANDAMNLTPINPDGLYSREQIVDPLAGEIVILTPITVGGLRDTARVKRYFSTIMIAHGGRQQPLGFELENCPSLEEAVKRWAEEAQKVGAKAQEQIRDQQVRSRLAVPAGARLPTLNS